MTDHTALIHRIEEAGAEQEAALVHEAVVLAHGKGWITDDQLKTAGTFWHVGAYLQAALILLPEGLWWVLNSGVQSGAALAKISAGKTWDTHDGNAATPALAVCVAALKARKE